MSPRENGRQAEGKALSQEPEALSAGERDVRETATRRPRTVTGTFGEELPRSQGCGRASRGVLVLLWPP